MELKFRWSFLKTSRWNEGRAVAACVGKSSSQCRPWQRISSPLKSGRCSFFLYNYRLLKLFSKRNQFSFCFSLFFAFFLDLICLNMVENGVSSFTLLMLKNIHFNVTFCTKRLFFLFWFFLLDLHFDFVSRFSWNLITSSCLLFFYFTFFFFFFLNSSKYTWHGIKWYHSFPEIKKDRKK